MKSLLLLTVVDVLGSYKITTLSEGEKNPGKTKKTPNVVEPIIKKRKKIFVGLFLNNFNFIFPPIFCLNFFK
jgi:hypothetical protein